MNVQAALSIAFFLASAAVAAAQPPSAPVFDEAPLPPGTFKGLIHAGARSGVLLADGRFVHPDETFAVTTHGHTVVWRVLEVNAKGARFARERAVDEEGGIVAPPQNCTPNLGPFLMLLERHAQTYSSLSTRLLKDQAMAAARQAAADWCASNQILCIRATLSDLSMSNDRTATLLLKHVDYGAFRSVSSPLLVLPSTLQAVVPYSRERALRAKAGDAVVLCGQPSFYAPEKGPTTLGFPTPPVWINFGILTDASAIGSLAVTDTACDIFDLKKETVK